MVNIRGALFPERTGRQPLYHVAIEELQEWTYTGGPLVPLKGFPGVVWQRSKAKKRRDHDGIYCPANGGPALGRKAAMNGLPCLYPSSLVMMPPPRRQRPRGREDT